MMDFRMPAEWTEHEGCLMAWPTRQELWGDVFDEVKTEYAQVASAIAQFEPVTMVALPGSGAEARERCGEGVTVVELPLDDSWFRDSGTPGRSSCWGPTDSARGWTSASTPGAASTTRTKPTTRSRPPCWNTSACSASPPG
ncbi:agmatine deiminase family protein [Streptomyces sp. NBC_00161]|uniref:agmatine deiminase family protein n=1 Tax=Streptomyces sp. NBC_00161 TaxID=2975671 RepID=UPI003251764A